MKLSVIIVSYNVKYYLEQCLHSLTRAAAGFDFEVFVIDNASTDGTVAYLTERFSNKNSWLHLIANSRNVGFSRANNIAYRKTVGEYILYLNPDTLLTEKTLSDCFDFMEQKKRVGGIGVRMLKADGSFALESRRGLPTPFTAFCKMSGLASLFPKSKLFGRYYMRYLNEREIHTIDVVSGAFMLVSRRALEDCGVFDETFFMYGEDIDLSYRLLKKGYSNYYIPTPILHYKGESTQKSTYRYVHVFYEAMLIFFNKHYSHYRFWFSFPIRCAIYLRAVGALVGQQMNHVKSIIRLPKNSYEDKYLFIGSREMLDEVRLLCNKWVLDGTFIELSPMKITMYTGHQNLVPSIEDYKYVVYDLSTFDYNKILSYFEQEGNVNQIGLYSKETKCLITSHNVFR